MPTNSKAFLVNPLDENQSDRLSFLLNDWKDNISPDDKETQDIVINDITKKMKNGVESDKEIVVSDNPCKNWFKGFHFEEFDAMLMKDYNADDEENPFMCVFFFDLGGVNCNAKFGYPEEYIRDEMYNKMNEETAKQLFSQYKGMMG